MAEIKLALLTVVFGGLWYKGKALDIENQILKAKKLGLEGISIETKRPVAFPLDLSKKKRAEIKEFANSQDIEICAVESMSNFASPIMEQRENNLAMMHDVIEMASDFGTDIVKVFAAWAGVRWEMGREIADYEPFSLPSLPRDMESLKQWSRVREGIKEVAKWANDCGITVAIQNHPPVLRPGYEDALAMVNEIGMDNIGLCLDVPLFYEKQGEEYIREAVGKCGKLIVLSHYGAWNFDLLDDGEAIQLPFEIIGERINYESYVRELVKVGFCGYLVQELCIPVLANHEYQGIEKVDQNNKAAAKYMKNLVGSL